MHALHHSTSKRWGIVAWSVPFALMGVCIALGMLGALYVSGGDNLLDEFSSDHIITVARYCVCLAIFCGVPYNTYMPRVVLLNLLKGVCPNWIVKDTSIPGNRFRRNVVHISLTVSLLLSALIVAEFITNLGLLFAVIGAISGVGIGLVLPPLCYLRLSDVHWTHRDNILVVIVLAIGIFSMIGCLASLLINEG
jgi:amino acid permease